MDHTNSAQPVRHSTFIGEWTEFCDAKSAALRAKAAKLEADAKTWSRRRNETGHQMGKYAANMEAMIEAEVAKRLGAQV